MLFWWWKKAMLNEKLRIDEAEKPVNLTAFVTVLVKISAPNYI